MKFEELLAASKFVVTSEIHLPSLKAPESVSLDSFDAWAWVDLLRVKVSPHDRPGSQMAAPCRALTQKDFALEFEVKTHNINRLEIARNVIDACNAGVDNFLIFTQDYWISGDSIQEMMYFHVDMGKFFSVTDALSRGFDVEGLGLHEKKTVCVGAGVDPRFGENAPDLQLREMEKLAEHGVRYFVTKPVFDLDKLSGFMEKISRLNVPVIAEVIMLRSAAEALLLNSMPWLHVPPRLIEELEKAEPNPEAALKITIEIIERLKGLCAGVHLLPYGDVSQIAPLREALRK